MQVPPMFSAIKVEGKRAYKSARKDKDLGLAARPVQVSEFGLSFGSLNMVAGIMIHEPDIVFVQFLTDICIIPMQLTKVI